MAPLHRAGSRRCNAVTREMSSEVGRPDLGGPYGNEARSGRVEWYTYIELNHITHRYIQKISTKDSQN